ncbi:mannitol dehydrogenase family protein [Leeuwenhoekiella aequorea]|uniref:Mannitol 2-dehydrogenase n=1 Tax=Leeuwenhoekiella aequorea TaxID=283736 RepID=A0A4V1KR29_9FLAO|nr:mannitol dehydrogenase family protein [Leeuwenhoekiella aequorea]RXG23472.1 mannitol 2-dehydrogenase [Leeuwenhoekiella aequorea]
MKNSVTLNLNNIDLLREHLSVPEYDPKFLKTGILHVGVGGFHRAHQAYYLNKLHEADLNPEWGICGIGLRENDKNIEDVFKKQDNLYTLLVKHPDGKNEAQVIGSIIDFKLGYGNPQVAIDKMAHPDTKIVSLTITEGGYNFNSSTGEFNFDNQDIIYELQNPEDPRTIYGYLTAALKKRRENSLPPFTIMSCDNIEHNGDVTREMLLTFAKRQDSELAEWIENSVSFPNSMVDRITPVTTAADIEFLENEYGIKDEWPVTCEPFIQWVIEDNFSNGRPQLENVGVQFVPDVKPYEKMKLRLLNAGHSVLGILGAVYGYKTINECMEDKVFLTYLRSFMDLEATPVLDELKGINLNDYKDSLEERFANPNIKDSVSRICSESAAKLPKFLIPTIQDNLKSGGNIDFGTLVLATWCYYSDLQQDQNGAPLEILDTMKNELHEAAQNTKEDALSFLRQTSVFGDLVNNDRFTSSYTNALDKVYKKQNIRIIMSDMI